MARLQAIVIASGCAAQSIGCTPKLGDRSSYEMGRDTTTRSPGRLASLALSNLHRLAVGMWRRFRPNANPDANLIADAGTDGYACPDSHTAPDAYACPDSHAAPDAYPNADSHAAPDAYPNADAEPINSLSRASSSANTYANEGHWNGVFS